MKPSEQLTMTTTFHRIRATALSVSAVLAMLPLAGLAQVPSPTAPAAAAAGDPPDRVARLNYFAGTVTLEPAGLSDWSYAALNRPLTTGDQLWADANARAELHAGSTALRLDQQTALDIVNLSDTSTQLKVTQGTLSAHVRALPAGQNFEIDTPNVALVASGPGLFRVDVAADGSSTTVTLRAGSATLYGDGGSFQMSAGQQIQFVGTALQQQTGGSAPALDAFDQWIATRDRAEDNSVSAHYVSREIPGYEDLDANGTWRSVPNYGEVWVPTTVTTGWAPYHEGHWAWVAPWGWTWVDDAPWGFAPFHYGRWAYIDRSWAWVPGPVVVTQAPVYAPALVAFVGGGGGGGGGAQWGVDLAIGGAVGAGVAWFALGPGEPWHPAYHTSPTYYSRINNVNITNVHNTTIINNVTNVHNTYINQNAPGAIAAVPANAFVHGESVAKAARPFNAQALAHAQIGAGAPAIAPVQQSFAGALRPAHVGAPAALAQREVVATRAPVVPAAYHDTLAQRFAASGGKVAGAGEPVVRSAAPAAFTEAAHPGKAGAVAAPAGFRVINRTQVRPVTAQGAPEHGNEAQAAHAPNPAEQQAHAPNAAAPKPNAKEPPRANQANEAHENGVPRPQNEAAEHAQPETHDARPAEAAPQPPRAPEGQHAQPEQQRAAEAPHAEAPHGEAPRSEPQHAEEAPPKQRAEQAAPAPRENPHPAPQPPQQHAAAHPEPAPHPAQQQHSEPEHKQEGEHKDDHPH
jgi:cell division protein FtsN